MSISGSPELDDGDEDAYHRLVSMDDYITNEMEQPWTDAEVQRVRDKLYNNYRRDAEKIYECVLGKLESKETHMFSRMNLLFILDKLCTESANQKSHDFYAIWKGMKNNLVKVVNLVLEIGEDDPPSRSANANVVWAKKILMGWHRRGLFPDEDITLCEKRIDQAEALDETAYEDAVRYEDEKIDRRMDADRERQKKDREDALLQNALEPWAKVSDDWFINLPDDQVLDVSEFWITASEELTEDDYNMMEIDNEKFRISAMELLQRAQGYTSTSPSVDATSPAQGNSSSSHQSVPPPPPPTSHSYGYYEKPAPLSRGNSPPPPPPPSMGYRSGHGRYGYSRGSYVPPPPPPPSSARSYRAP
ncbi:hypothetical protein SpCBS45565_g00127 [Spizellomyces sp. 'palustris']|nr:hypothetical protein SpCBS45565_g00127 [Spizellomyces sp. 'palustris']